MKELFLCVFFLIAIGFLFFKMLSYLKSVRKIFLRCMEKLSSAELEEMQQERFPLKKTEWLFRKGLIDEHENIKIRSFFILSKTLIWCIVIFSVFLIVFYKK